MSGRVESGSTSTLTPIPTPTPTSLRVGGVISVGPCPIRASLNRNHNMITYTIPHTMRTNQVCALGIPIVPFYLPLRVTAATRQLYRHATGKVSVTSAVLHGFVQFAIPDPKYRHRPL